MKFLVLLYQVSLLAALATCDQQNVTAIEVSNCNGANVIKLSSSSLMSWSHEAQSLGLAGLSSLGTML
jgi:hypothetical protein